MFEKKLRIPNTESHTPLRDEFEAYYAKEIRPGESKRMADAFEGYTDDQSTEALNAWEDFLEGEFMESCWEQFLHVISEIDNNSQQQFEKLNREISRLSEDVHESAAFILKQLSSSEDPEAVQIYFLNYAGLSQRAIATRLGCSVGKVNARIKAIETETGIKLRKFNKKSTIKPPSTDQMTRFGLSGLMNRAGKH